MTERLRRILRRLPTWFRMRYDEDAVGRQLMEALAVPIDIAETELDGAYREFYLGTADPNAPAWVYRAVIDRPQPNETIAVIGNGLELEPVPDLYTFLRAFPTDPLHEEGVFYENPYLYDDAYRTIYVRKPYGETPEAPGGFIDVIYRRNGIVTRSARYRLYLHHIWNAFDEFALMASLERRAEEDNESLRQRIWDRFRFPRHAGPAGIASRIGQVMGNIRQRIWEDQAQPFVIPEPNIMPELVVVDGLPLEEGSYYVDKGNRVVLLPTYREGSATIRYIAGITVRQATIEDVKEHTQEIESVTPRWGYMRYDVAFWAPEELGSALAPVHYDPDLRIWLQ